MKELPIEFFRYGLIRTPIYPIDDIKSLDFNRPSFAEAIYLASDSLYEDAYEKKLLNENTLLSLTRYYLRACTRCTPYGNFAGCVLVKNGDKSFIEPLQEKYHKTYTRVDMGILCHFIRHAERNPNIRNVLKYHLNTSLYSLPSSIHYVEYSIKSTKRHYIYSEVKRSEYLDKIISNLSDNNLTIKELSRLLIAKDVSEEDAILFINELIDEQLIVSELEPSVAGDELMKQLQEKLYDKPSYLSIINELINDIDKCDNLPIGTRIDQYKATTKKIIEAFKTESKNIIHSDCSIQIHGQASISKSILKAAQKGMAALYALSYKPENKLLDRFRQDFYNRFEEQEIPLTLALDPQIGIPFGSWNSAYGDEDTLIKGLAPPFTHSQSNTYTQSKGEQLLIEKYEKMLASNSEQIILTEEDLDELSDFQYEELPNQMYSTIQVINKESDENEAEIYMNYIAGGCAANLLSRFAYLDKEIDDFIKEIIIQQDSTVDKQVIIAEVLHLPEDRIGNIQMHPIHRRFGIAYLSNPINSSLIQTLNANDIMVSTPGGKTIQLRSKKLNRIIIPVLTTAHNYSTGLPIYYFLCALQQQYNISFQFNWGYYFSNKTKMPRVRFENIILSPATWFVSYLNFPKKEKKESSKEYMEKVNEWRTNKEMPTIVLLVEGDNKLYIDFSNEVCVKILSKQMKKAGSALLEEFLFSMTKHPLVNRGNKWFTNELIICAHRK